MWSFSLKTLRHHAAGAVGTFVVVMLATTLLTTVGILGESALRGGVDPDRYADADVVVTTSLPTGLLAALSTTTPAPVSRTLVDQIAALDGVEDVVAEANVAMADAAGQPVTAHDGALAVRSGAQVTGRMPDQPGEVAVDAGTGHGLGEQITLTRGAVPARYTVVGIVDRSASAGRPHHAYLHDADVQRLAPTMTDKASVLAVFAASGTSATQLAALIEAEIDGVDATTGRARGQIEFPDSAHAAGAMGMLVVSFAGVGLVVVAIVVTSTSSLSVRQRHRQIALLRALGATPQQVRATLTREVFAVALLGAVVGAVPGLLAAPLVRRFLVNIGFLPADFHLAAASGSAMLGDYQLTVSPGPAGLAVVAVLLACLVAARCAARRPARTSPVEALREAEVEQPRISGLRTGCALAAAIAGLAAIGAQFVVPGSIGVAVALAAALLFVVAFALAGPPLVDRLAALGSRLPGAKAGASMPLALANSRGFSRRLTGAILPLTLAVVLGVVQLTSHEVMGAAGVRELTDGLIGDAVVTAPAGIAPQVLGEIDATPGVESATPVVTAQAYLGTRDVEERRYFEQWEPLGLLVVDPSTSEGLLDPQVRSGRLSDLARPGTIALSVDTQIEQDLVRLGEPVRARFADGTVDELDVVAIYDRGLGFGDAIVGPATWQPHAVDDLVNAVVVSFGAGADPGHDLTAAGLTVQNVAAHAQAVGVGQEPLQRVSASLVLALVVFVILAALNTLAMATLARRSEFRLYQLLGARRRQVVRIALAETTVVATLAIGASLAIVGPIVGVISVSTLGSAPPPSIGVAFLALAGVVALVAFLGVAGTAALRAPRGGLSRPA